MPLVVSDSSTLIHLAAIGRIALLKHFHQTITITPAVWQEVVVEGGGRAGACQVEAAREGGWIEVAAPEDEELLGLLRREPDLGQAEAETIALAVERQADLVFLDETEARCTARVRGLRTAGVVGILIRAKVNGRIQSLQAAMNALQERSGFWIGEELYW